MELADSHIHLFREGFAGRYGPAFARANEPALYEAFRRVHGIGPALVVGYEGEAQFAGNNADIAAWSRDREWVWPLQYRGVDNPPSANLTIGTPYRGIALYAMGEAEAVELCGWPAAATDLLNGRRCIVSLNARPEALAALRPFLDRLGDCAILASHLGLPGAYGTPPTPEEARSRLAPLLRLASLPHVGVKISGLYSLSDPSHDYPHHSARPFLNELLNCFGPYRLYWGSDFSPALQHVSFAQTVDVLSHTNWDSNDVEAIMGGNLRGLLNRLGA